MRKSFLFAATSFVAAALGCGDGGPGPGSGSLAVESTRPAGGATGVEAGTTVQAYFNRALNPATVDITTFTLSTGGTDLARQVTYDATSEAAVLSGPLLPGRTYDATVHTGIRDVGGTALPAAHAWSFSTRTWQPVAVDQTGDVGLYTSLGVDGSGRLHVSYFDQTNADLKYASCAADCTTPANWQTVAVDQPGVVGTLTSLAVDGSGRVHVSYVDETNFDLKYATCATSCTTAANWQTVAVDQTGLVGYYSSVAVDGSGRVHVSYYDNMNADLKYATCAAGCAIAANWQTVPVDQTGEVGPYTSFAVEGTGRVHVSYRDDTNFDLKYATCAASCTAAANWQSTTVDQTGSVGDYSSLAVDGNGRVHVSYRDNTNGDLKYATCTASCTTVANWQTTTLDHTGVEGDYSSLAVDGSGRVHVSYSDGTNGDLKYATCAASCTTAAGWQTVAVDETGVVGLSSSLALDGSGAVHVSYWDFTNGDLKYIR